MHLTASVRIRLLLRASSFSFELPDEIEAKRVIFAFAVKFLF